MCELNSDEKNTVYCVTRVRYFCFSGKGYVFRTSCNQARRELVFLLVFFVPVGPFHNFVFRSYRATREKADLLVVALMATLCYRYTILLRISNFKET